MAEADPSSHVAPGGANRAAGRGVDRITVALAGNPNSGKTTIFNHLTGSHQHVGNYPGVTVEKKTGVCHHRGVRLDVVDLPGTYSLTAYSTDELVAREFVIDEHPDVVVDILDASNLERHLYLAVQFMELGLPLVLVLNMSDVAAAQGYVVDLDRLSGLLGGVPLVPAVGNRGQGIDAIRDAILAVATGERALRPVPITYGRELDREIEALTAALEPEASRLAPRRPRWVALKLLENDARIRERVERVCASAAEVLAATDAAVGRLRTILGDAPEIVIADRRYGFISGACQETVRSTVELRHTRSDQIDAIVTHPLLGLPLFLGLMYLVFWATFSLGEYPMQGIDRLFQWLGEGVSGLWPQGSPSALRSLLVDGVIRGVGGVIVFVPSIGILFLAIALLEDSGYMARAAFIVDRWMHKIGLHGKSFIPMVIGFGCTVPAILATRVLENRRDRLTTMLVLPLMSCGARLPIYVLLTGAFFAERWRAPVMWILYLVGMAAAVLLAKLLRATLLRGETEPFVMELPPYRAPTLQGTLLHMWQRVWMYVRKAGTIILGVSVVLWALSSYPKPPAEVAAGLAPPARRAAALEYSVAGRIGQAMEPVTRPLGFDWRVNTALVGAFAAKEVFVVQMGIVHSLGDGRTDEPDLLHQTLRDEYSPLQAVAIMVFCLLGFPCMATVAVMRSESGSWKWALLQWAGLTVLAYGVTLIVYQVGTALGIGAG
ncbi:MAG TPA: ferrous iron transport protein B [Phycisphaerae bacterium]|nr:ferrous iron transport protein B [Phycisphaerae bacterium]